MDNLVDARAFVESFSHLDTDDRILELRIRCIGEDFHKLCALNLIDKDDLYNFYVMHDWNEKEMRQIVGKYEYKYFQLCHRGSADDVEDFAKISIRNVVSSKA